MQPLIVEARRGDGIESTHAVSAAVVSATGSRIAWSGHPERRTFLRSAAKPFQAMPLVLDGVVARYTITDEELALACASHNSEPRQVAVVGGLLDRLGLAESDLVCGPHRALSAVLSVTDPDEPPPEAAPAGGSLSSNCSGKHVGMLALALHRGWPTAGYGRAEHPVQQRCKRELSNWTGVPADRIGEAVDGCGVTCFQVPLEAMALGFARLGTRDEPGAAAIRRAMMGHPDLVAGPGRLCTELMRRYPLRVLAKVGADGVYGVALPDRGWGIALKVEDGNNRAAMAALLAVLDQLDLDPAPSESLPRFARFPVRNTRGEDVGRIAAAGRLTFA